MADTNRRMSNAIIKVIGVGGGGGNAINTMIESGLEGVEFIAANTDIQALQSNLAPLKIQLGRELTKGLGAAANPDVGHDAALEDKAIIQEVIGSADMVFVTAGMGGGTGTGAAPVIAQVAREMGALTVGVVTKPFIFEGKKRKNYGELGIQQLRASVDTLITIPNQRLLAIAPPSMSMLDGFRLADDVLLNAVKGISEIINIPDRINVDFADVKTVMAEMGMALMGTGIASGPNRATEAAQAAISSPLLEDVDIEGATGLLINITGPESMTLHEISVASSLIQEAAHEDANIILGAAIDPALHDELRVTVIATGFDRAYVTPPDRLIRGDMLSGRRGPSESRQGSMSFPTGKSAHSSVGPNQQSGFSSASNPPHSAVNDESSRLARSEAEQLMKLTLHLAGTPGAAGGHSTASTAAPSSQSFDREVMGRSHYSQALAAQSQAQSAMTESSSMRRSEYSSRPSDGAPRSQGDVSMRDEEPMPDFRIEPPHAGQSHETAAERHSDSQGQGIDWRSGAVSSAPSSAHHLGSGPGSKDLHEGQTIASTPDAHGSMDPLTLKALKIAQEFADDEDFERPAFLRQREPDRPFE